MIHKLLLAMSQSNIDSNMGWYKDESLTWANNLDEKLVVVQGQIFQVDIWFKTKLNNQQNSYLDA
jgi:hypothetical protein